MLIRPNKVFQMLQPTEKQPIQSSFPIFVFSVSHGVVGEYAWANWLCFLPNILITEVSYRLGAVVPGFKLWTRLIWVAHCFEMWVPSLWKDGRMIMKIYRRKASETEDSVVDVGMGLLICCFIMFLNFSKFGLCKLPLIIFVCKPNKLYEKKD